MPRVEKTVFISYRRTNVPWALAIHQHLTHHGYDVFFDFTGIATGSFESVILENVRARAHFVVLLTPSALDRCQEPEDWLRREIETALDTKRNIVPLMLEGFDFATPGIAEKLTGTLAPLRGYNALRIPAEYFEEAMERLKTKWLNVALEGVSHPAPASAVSAAKKEQAAAVAAPKVQEKELTAQEWFERAYYAKDLDEQISLNTQAIRLKPDYATAFFNRGYARRALGDVAGAIQDYDEAIRLKPDDPDAFNNRGVARIFFGDFAGAIDDCNESLRLAPYDAYALDTRGTARMAQGDAVGAILDYSRAIQLKPDLGEAFYNRSLARKAQGDPEGSKQDMAEAKRLGFKPKATPK